MPPGASGGNHCPFRHFTVEAVLVSSPIAMPKSVASPKISEWSIECEELFLGRQWQW
jgi:hypothetical protein